MEKLFNCLFCYKNSFTAEKKFEWKDLNELTNKQSEELKNITLEKTKQFSFEGLQFYAKVLSTHNGDTCRVCFFYKDEMIQTLCKMNGYHCKINTQEIANKRLSELVLNKIVKIKCGKNDIYGRTFIDIYIKDPQGGSQLHVNYLMISEKITGFKQTIFSPLASPIFTHSPSPSHIPIQFNQNSITESKKSSIEFIKNLSSNQTQIMTASDRDLIFCS